MELETAAYPSYRQAKIAAMEAAEEIKAHDSREELWKWHEEKGNEIFGKLRDFETQTGNYGEHSYADWLNSIWQDHCNLLMLKEITIGRNNYGTRIETA